MRMPSIIIVAGGVLVLLVCLADSVRAQGDFRSVDDGRPVRVEDAYPIKFLEWEWELGWVGEIAEGGSYGTDAVAELKTGFARNWQLGVEVHSGIERASGVSQSGVEEFAAHVFFNFNQEGPRVPAFAIRADVMAPGIGDVARDEVAARIRGMATRSFGRLRLHANTALTWAAQSDGGDFWSGGLAFDRPIGFNGWAVVGDVYFESPLDAGGTKTWLDIGSRFQMSKVLTLDVGLSSRLDEWMDGVPNIGLTVGVSRMFGIPGLVRPPIYPNPRIR